MQRNIIISIILLLLSAGIIYYLLQPIKLSHEFHGLQRISPTEIESKLAPLGLDGKSILQINPLQITSILEKSPLIKQAKIKTQLFPKTKLAIFIEENQPWAIYRDQVLGDQAQTLIASRLEAVASQSEAVNKIYDDFYRSKTDLVELVSTRALNDEELQLLKRSHDLINDNLDLIASNVINGSELGHIRMIRVNRVNNVFFYSDQLKFITGMMDEALFERVKRLETIVPKMVKLSSSEELSYVDLSLDTNEVLLGKSQ